VDVGLHLPLFTALFELAPERDADGDEAHQKDLECHAPSRQHPLCQRSEREELLDCRHRL